LQAAGNKVRYDTNPGTKQAELQKYLQVNKKWQSLDQADKRGALEFAAFPFKTATCSTANCNYQFCNLELINFCNPHV